MNCANCGEPITLRTFVTGQIWLHDDYVTFGRRYCHLQVAEPEPIIAPPTLEVPKEGSK